MAEESWRLTECGPSTLELICKSFMGITLVGIGL